MGSWSSLVWVNIVTLSGTVLIPIIYYMFVGVEGIRPEDSQVVPIANLNPTGVLHGLSTFTFGLTSQFMLTEIIGEMKDPNELPKAYACISAPFQLVAFMVASLGGYFFIGDKVSGPINENLPFGIALQIAALCLATHMLISYLLKGVVVCSFFQMKIDPSRASPSDKRWSSWISWSVMVVAVLFVAWLTANVVPFFSEAVDLLGSLFAPLACWMLPIVFFMRFWYDAGTDRPKVSYAEWLLIAVEFVFALVLMVFGTIAAVQHIIEEWDTFGMPFSCHCENLWKTCECSAAHIGMETCNMTGV